MLELIVLIKRASTLTPEAFRSRWSANNSGIYRSAPGCSRYVQCAVVAEPPPLPGLPTIPVSIDAIEKIAFANEAAMEAAMQASPPGWSELALIAQAMSIHAVRTVVVRDTGVNVANHARMLKRLVLVKRKNSWNREQYFKHWIDIHGALARRVPGGPRYYAQHHSLREIANPAGIPSLGLDLDGFSETWYDNDVEMHRAAATPEGRALAQDNLTFNGQSKRFFFDEVAP